MRSPPTCIPAILRAVSAADLYGQSVKALERGMGADAASLLVRALRQPGLHRDEQVQMRCALAEAWMMQYDWRKAAAAMGPTRSGRERLDPARYSILWRRTAHS